MAGKRRRFFVIDSSSDEEDSNSHTLTVNAVVHRDEVKSTEASGQHEFLEQSCAEGAPSISAEHSVNDLSDDPPITSVSVPQSDRGINEMLTQAGNIEELFAKNTYSLDYVAEKSKYSQYKKKKSNFQNCLNIIATVEKVSEKMNQDQQERFQKTVIPIYKDLKSRQFPVNEVSQLLKRAVKVVEKENSTGILRFFQRKPKEGSGTGSFFVGGTAGRNNVGSRDGGYGTGSGEGSFGVQGFSTTLKSQEEQTSRTNLIQDNDKIETEVASEHAGSPTATVSIQNLIQSLLENNEYLYQYKYTDQLNLEISLVDHITQKVERFKREIFILEDNQKRAWNKKSDLKTDINVAKKELGDLKTLLKRYHDLSEKGNNEVEKAKTISEKANILNEVVNTRNATEKEINDCMLKMEVSSKLPEITKRVRKRNLTNEAKRNKEEQGSNYESHRANWTWGEAFQRLEQITPFSNGVSLSIDKAELIKKAFDEKGFLSIDDIVEATDGTEYQEKGLRKLILEHLPVVSLKKDNYGEKYVDARMFLKEPSLIVQMWERQTIFKAIIFGVDYQFLIFLGL